MTNPEDQWHQEAVAARERLPDKHLTTTEDVLVGFLTYFGAHGAEVRRTAALIARAILDYPEVEVVLHTTDLFLDGLELYEKRLDKSYSLVDCMSMEVMRGRGLTDVLTHDHHFTQEGFNYAALTRIR